MTWTVDYHLRDPAVRAAIELAGRRWQCLCGCRLTCPVCWDLLEAYVLNDVSWVSYHSHGSLHKAAPPTVPDDGVRRRARHYADDKTTQRDVVDLMRTPLGYRLIRAAGMRRDNDP
jgi:hypothetical protein